MTRVRRSIAVLSVVLLVPLSACAQESGSGDEPAESAAPGSAAREPAGGAAAASREMTWTGVLGEEEFKALHELKTGESPELHGTMVDLAGGGAYLSLPAEGEAPFPGIVVIQEWWGLNDNIKLWADRLAADGYAALAVDLYDGTVAVTRDEAMAAVNAVQDERALEILQAGFRFLKNDPRVRAPKIGSIGWCFGGGWSLRLAIAQPELDACVIYYGRLIDDPAELAKIKAPLCGIFGNQDTGIPPDAVDAFDAALQEAGADYQIHRFDAEHAFANPSNARYDEEAATRAWNVVVPFLAHHLKE
ncbi:MAG TPA: dienelactone hydrolase family protein [bacterium]|nr:dienelactone hydrolase family protein [bacterium]